MAWLALQIFVIHHTNCGMETFGAPLQPPMRSHVNFLISCLQNSSQFVILPPGLCGVAPWFLWERATEKGGTCF